MRRLPEYDIYEEILPPLENPEKPLIEYAKELLRQTTDGLPPDKDRRKRNKQKEGV
jgi:hypothetical protein